MATFEPNTIYTALGARAFEGETTSVLFKEVVNERAVFKFNDGSEVRKRISTDEKGEYVWLSAAWSVHSKNKA